MKVYKSSIGLLLLFLFYSTTVLSQNTKTDSLKRELSFHKEKDTIRVKLLFKIVENNYKYNYEDNVKYLDEAETISKEIGYKKGAPISLFYRGLITSQKSKYNSGDEYYKKAIPLYEEVNMKQQVINCYRNLSIINTKRGDYNEAIYFRKKCLEYKESIGNKKTGGDLFYIGYYYYITGKFDECISYYNKAIRISKKNNNHKLFQDCLTALGNLYSHQGNYPLALEYLNNALDNAKKHRGTKNISDALVSLGNTYIRLQDYDNAISFHEKALKEPNHDNYGAISHNLGESYKYKKDYDKALELFKDALDVYREKNNIPDEAITLNKIGEIYFEKNDMNEAYAYFEKAKNINIEVDNLRGLSGSYLGLGKIYFKREKYNQALSFALKCKEIATKLELIDIQRDIEQLLFNIYKKNTDYKKSLISHEEYKRLNDSLFNKENIEKITQLEYEYKYKKALDSASLRELKLTKTVKTTSQDLEKSQRNLFLGVIAFLTLALALVAIIFFLKLRHEKTKTQNIAIEQKLLRSQMTPHFIFNSLSVLQGMILNKEEKKSVFYLSKFSKLLRITLENSRDKIVPLQQELEAVSNYLELQNLEESQSYHYTILVDEAIDETVFKIPPMLIQPFIENAIEHAFNNQKENRKIDVKLTYSNEELICIITDNGIGIDSQNGHKRKDKKSLATTITSERLKALSKDFNMQGSVDIEDAKVYGEQGTIVTLVLPYKIVEA